MATINLNVGETMYLRVIGSKYPTNTSFNCLTIRGCIDNTSIVVKMKDSFIRDICNSLCDKGLFREVDKEKDLYSLTEFGKASYETIMDKVAGRARCGSGNSYSGEVKKHE